VGESTKHPDSIEIDRSGVGFVDESDSELHNDSLLLGVPLPVLSSLKLRVKFVIGEPTLPSQLLFTFGDMFMVLLVASVLKAKLGRWCLTLVSSMSSFSVECKD